MDGEVQASVAVVVVGGSEDYVRSRKVMIRMVSYDEG